MIEFFNITKEKLILFVILTGVNFVHLNLVYAYRTYTGSLGFISFFIEQVALNINAVPLLVIPVLVGLFESAVFRLVMFSIGFLIYWYVISCSAVFLYKRYKKNSKVLAGILLAVIILIAVSASSMAHPRFQKYQERQLSRRENFIILDGFCIGGETANVLVKNVGTLNVSLANVKVIDTSTNKVITDQSWTTVDGTRSIAELEPGKTGKFSTNCTGYCTWFFYGGPVAVTQRVSVACKQT